MTENGLWGMRHLFLRLFFENGFKHWRSYSISFVFMGIVAAATGLSAWIIKDVINEIFMERNQAMITPIALAVAIIFFVKGLATYAQTVILTRTGNRIVADIQSRLFDHVLLQRIDFFDTYSIGDLSTRFSHNSNSAREAISIVVTSLGRDFLSLLALITVMIIQDPGMALVAFLVAPPAIVGVTILIKQIKTVARAEFLSLAKIVTTIQESAIGIRVVKSFALEPVMRKEIRSAIDGVRQRSDAMAKISAATSPLMETLGGIAIALVILYAGWRVIGSDADPGAFFSFLTALLLAYEPAKRLARLNVTLQAQLIGVELMYQLLDATPQITEHKEAVMLPCKPATIQLNDVSFCYDAASAPALNEISLEAQAGHVTALVGPSGGGKSTIFSMIERFFDPQKGTVTIGAQNLNSVSFQSLRNAVASVSQNPFLFDGSVHRNILMGRLDASEEDILNAAKAANAHEFIEALPEGYNTRVGEDGIRLSGGQRQRIAIARAMLRNAPILLLDEATSSLDAQSEARVAEALDRLMTGRTTLVIAHRLSTVRNADMIHVIERGRVVQSGSHNDLIGTAGLYAQLYGLQYDTSLNDAI